MSYRKQRGYRKCGGKYGKRRRSPRKTGVRLPAVIMGTVLILILCGRVILTGGIGEITGQAAESQAVGAAAAVDAAPGQKDNRAEQAHQVKNAQEQDINQLLKVRREKLKEDKEARLIREGYPENEVEDEAAKVVAYPGTSEHQLGLALDIVDVSYQQLDTEQENTPVQQWLMKNSWKYGFVLRYPTDKSDITGIIYEPWHYRYVGKEAAAEIYENKLCLEEYLGIN